MVVEVTTQPPQPVGGPQPSACTPPATETARRSTSAAAAQVLHFIPISTSRGEGVTEVSLRVDTPTTLDIPPATTIGGVRFTTEAIR